MFVSTVCGLNEKFIGVGDEVEEGLEVGFVFSFVQFVIEGAFLRIGFVLFLLFDKEFGGEYFAAEVAVVEGGVVNAFVEDLQLRDGKFCGQQFEENRMEGGLIAKLFFCDVDHSAVIEDQVRQLLYVHPFGVVFVAELFLVLVDVDEGEVGDAESPFDGVAVGFAEGLHLFHINPFDAGEFFQDAVGGLLEAFLFLEEAAHEAPFASFRFQAALYEQKFNIRPIKSEDDTVYGHQHSGFPRITIHVLNLVRE